MEMALAPYDCFNEGWLKAIAPRCLANRDVLAPFQPALPPPVRGGASGQKQEEEDQEQAQPTPFHGFLLAHRKAGVERPVFLFHASCLTLELLRGESPVPPRPLEPLMKNIVYFDLETQKSAEEVGGWGNISRMGMSVGVIYSVGQGAYRIFGEKQVGDLITELQRADLVVGFNNLRFDYEVLHGYTSFDLRQLPTLDMLVELQNELRHRLSLDSIATATFGVEKTAEGMQAIQWYREGKLLEIAEYCCYDVKLTRLVHEYGVQHRQLHYHNRFGKKMSVPVRW
jgi:DEAD/DEAH box helicase domain-containing protein